MAVYVAIGVSIAFWILMFWLFGWYAVAIYVAIGVYTVFKARRLMWYVEPVHNLIGKG